MIEECRVEPRTGFGRVDSREVVVACRQPADLEAAGLVVGARAKSEAAGDLCEMIELPEHPWFFGCQFHPEFTSNPRRGHPLFIGFVRAALDRQRHATSGSASDAVAELVASI